MDDLSALFTPPVPSYYLVQAARQPGKTALNHLAARLALAGPVTCIDGGNAINPHAIARLVRRYSLYSGRALARVQIARAFTCYELIRLLVEAVPLACPTLVLDLLSTFADESITQREKLALFEQAQAALQRLSQQAPLCIWITPPDTPFAAGLARQLEAQAGRVVQPTPPSGDSQMRLF